MQFWSAAIHFRFAIDPAPASRDIKYVRAAIELLGVGEASAPSHLSTEDRDLRRRLRIHGYQLGDHRDSKSTNPNVGKQKTDRLIEEVAYEDAVNASEVKIVARELPAVTQLFTEDYMVEFLLDNTIGAWWAGKRLTTEGIGPHATEDEWVALAEQSGEPLTALSRQPVENGLRNLHALFSDAPTLGSLIDPNRELSSKVFKGQCKLIELGYRQGGPAGFGLRRMLIDHTHKEKGILARGEEKSLQTDRVILVPGPEEEVRIVQCSPLHRHLGLEVYLSLRHKSTFGVTGGQIEQDGPGRYAWSRKTLQSP